jgi:hypothetical protein
MNPILEQALVFAVIGGAVGFFVVRFIRARRKKTACSSDCGCSMAKPHPEFRRPSGS